MGDKTKSLKDKNEKRNKEENKEENSLKKRINKFITSLGLQFTVIINFIYGALMTIAVLQSTDDAVFRIFNSLYLIYLVCYLGMSVYCKKFKNIGFAILGIPIGVTIAAFIVYILSGGMFLNPWS